MKRVAMEAVADMKTGETIVSGAHPRVWRLRPWAAVAAVAATLWLGGCGDTTHEGRQEEVPTVSAPAARVERVERADRVEVYGTVGPEKEAAVSARVSAMVTAVKVRTGDRVARGQGLIEIDSQLAQGQVAQARGALAQARAALVLAERNRRRFEALESKEAASELEVDRARMQHEQAVGAVAQAEGAVQAAATVAADVSVEAPFDARVVERMVEVGDLATPGRPLLRLESERGRRLEIQVPETVASRASLGVGQRIPVRIDVRPDLGTFEGEIVETSPGLDPRTHTLEVMIALPHDDVPTGSTGRAMIGVGRSPVLLLPEAAVIRRGGLSLVVVATPEGRAVTRVVTLGSRVEHEEGGSEGLEVLSGLEGGEMVLLGLAAAPPAGARAEIREESEA